MSIAIRNLVVQAQRSTLVRDVSFDVAPGTWCTIVGPNGAGKTTLLGAMAGLRPISAGHVHIEGHDIHALGERARAKLVAFVPQSPIVPIGMAVRDFVMLGRTSAHGMLRAPSSADVDIVEGVIARLALGELRARDVATLSGGEQQRVVIARTLAQGTRVVLLDEPTTGLDVRHQMAILELLKKEVDECQLTVVATLHDLTQAGLFADQMVLLDQGSIARNATPKDVLRSDALAASYGTKLRVLDVDGRDVVIPERR